MASWSLRWRILGEAALLVAVTATAATLFNITGAVVVGVGAALIAAYRARKLSAVFSRMTEGVLRTASVDRNFRISPGGPAELNRMARAVNRLADRLVAAIDESVEERARFSSILNAMAEGVLLVGANGTVDFANPAAVELLSPDNRFVPGSHITHLTNSFEINEIAAACAEHGEAREARVNLISRNRFVRVRATPVDDRDGDRRAVVILTDLTEVRRTETTRREFVSNASHELRTPISAIRAAVETLQRGAAEDPAARRDFLDRIEQDTARLDNMVQEMLELSRLESGQAKLNLSLVEPAELLDRIAHRFGPLAEDAGIEVCIELSRHVPAVTADADKLEHVFTNLVTNAVRAMEDGGKLTLAAIRSGKHVEFSVADNGPGIPAAHIPHIFERFYKLDYARNSAGTGLGLAIAKHIVQAHRGSITVESREGSGARFLVSLPVNQAEP
jgi:two-component system phosphate regulon sensor histidine kinase PhoR